MTMASTVRRAWQEKTFYGLLFMLPVAGISVRHWLSGSFLVLALWSLGYLRRPRESLTREERVFLAICAFYFTVFVVTALINGWTDQQTRFLGREIRFLFIIPIYLMLRRYPDAGVWLLRGGIIGALVILANSLYDVLILGKPFAEGAYSQLLLGPFAALLVIWLLTAWQLEHDRFFRRLIPFSAVAAFVSVALSGARGAYLGLLGLASIWLAMNLRGRRLALGALAAVAITLAAVAILPTVAQRAGIAIAEFNANMRTDDPATLEGRFNAAPGHLGSVSARLQMWRAAWLMFKDHPVWGVGRGNYEKAVVKYVERGLVHPDVAQNSHPHNAFLGTMASKGTVGLLAILALLLYPLAVFVRTFKRSPQTAMLGITHISGFAIFSLFESAPFNKGNFITIFLIFLATFFAWHVQRSTQRGP
ncbi:MAG: hypothetical protein BMS9Abin10_0961 [Gammaproteobacteria bacterium]|nr:MAG: hypothetical protein BMS9Abin10_0961 [Gammaproteobacteria bacterium]